ncbi:MAG: hypothetical protein J5699_02280 [Bacteroidales bacterium]|nr:hypothetical protein [Bacteroidales bacterium]
MGKAGKIIGISTFVILLLLAAFCYFKFWWVFSDGTKTGELNSLTYTGYIFKTYEGEIILTGYGTKAGGSSVQSKNFKFSARKSVAEELQNLTGQRITVHYKEYMGALPWRGYEKSIVDKVISAEPIDDSTHKTPEETIFL